MREVHFVSISHPPHFASLIADCPYTTDIYFIAIRSKGAVTLTDVCDFVKQTKLSHVDLGPEEVLQIVNTLVYDGKVRVAFPKSRLPVFRLSRVITHTHYERLQICTHTA